MVWVRYAKGWSSVNAAFSIDTLLRFTGSTKSDYNTKLYDNTRSEIVMFAGLHRSIKL